MSDTRNRNSQRGWRALAGTARRRQQRDPIRNDTYPPPTFARRHRQQLRPCTGFTTVVVARSPSALSLRSRRPSAAYGVAPAAAAVVPKVTGSRAQRVFGIRRPSAESSPSLPGTGQPRPCPECTRHRRHANANTPCTRSPLRRWVSISIRVTFGRARTAFCPSRFARFVPPFKTHIPRCPADPKALLTP